MAKAAISKGALLARDTSVVPPGVSQVTVLDAAEAQIATLGPGWFYLHGASDPAAGAPMFVEVALMRLRAGAAVPAIDGFAALNALLDDLWQQASVSLGPGGAGTVAVQVRTQREFRTGDRLVMVIRTFSMAGVPVTRTVEVRGQLMRIQP